jgi:hypothetical protein
MKSTALPSWLYGDPSNICDGLIARTARKEKALTFKPMRIRKDRFYTMSRSVHIKALIKFRKRNGA